MNEKNLNLFQIKQFNSTPSLTPVNFHFHSFLLALRRHVNLMQMKKADRLTEQARFYPSTALLRH